MPRRTAVFISDSDQAAAIEMAAGDKDGALVIPGTATAAACLY
jgi:N-acetylglucosamine kinase-like BadF-type ATPase